MDQLTAGTDLYTLRLYVCGSTPASTRAVANVKAACEEFLPNRYDLSIIDLYQNPAQAQDDRILAAPTLVKAAPPPVRRCVGDLSQTDCLFSALGLNGEV